MISSPFAKNQALSVHRCLNNESSSDKPVGFYRTWVGSSEMFVISENSVGLSDEVFGEKKGKRKRIPVPIGSEVVLRSISTGEFLQLSSVDIEGGGIRNIILGGSDKNVKFRTFQVGKVEQGMNPSWLYGNDFISIASNRNSFSDLEKTSLPQDIVQQENLVISNLLDALMGYSGDIFYYNTSTDNFEILKIDGFDPSFTTLCHRMLPLCENYVRVESYITLRLAHYEYGLISQALASSLDQLMKEYLLLITQLEGLITKGQGQKRMSLQKIWCFLQPSIFTMQTLASVAKQTNKLKGGALLNEIFSMLNYMTDEHSSNLLTHLLRAASKPYFDMLNEWVYFGRLVDTYGEFIIVDNHSNLSDFDSSSWYECYTLRNENVLSIFSSTYKSEANMSLPQKILSIGKYLNVIRKNKCEDMRSLFSGDISKLQLGDGILTIQSKIDSIFDFVAESLQTLIFSKCQLLDRMRCVIKRYFLLHHQGPDFFIQFLDTAESDLLHNVDDISRERINSLLSMAIQSCEGSSIENIASLSLDDRLCCDFAPMSLIDHLDALHSMSGGLNIGVDIDQSTIQGMRGQDDGITMTGMETFMLDYKVESGPLSLIISRKSIANYQLIFRHLFFCKHVERCLFSVWLDHQTIKELMLRRELGMTYCLRQRMLHFLQNFVYYMMFDVIEPQWIELEEKLKASKTIDNILVVHESFQHTVMKECLLTSQTLLKILAKLMSTCLLFSEQMRRFFEDSEIDNEYGESATKERLRRFNLYENRRQKTQKQVALERHKRVESITKRLKVELNKPAYTNMISKFERVFDALLAEFMDELDQHANTHYHSNLSNLCVRLDFNGYYSNRQ